MIAVVTLQVAESAFIIRSCSTRSRRPGSTDVVLQRGTCSRYEKSNPLISSGYCIWRTKVTWQYRYRILSEYCTMWLTKVTWNYRYRILCDHCTMRWIIVTWNYRYRILSDYWFICWTIATWHHRYRILIDYWFICWTIVTWHWRHLNLCDYSTTVHIARLNNENSTLPQKYLRVPYNSYNKAPITSLECIFNYSCIICKQTVRTAAWTQSLYPHTTYIKFNLH